MEIIKLYKSRYDIINSKDLMEMTEDKDYLKMIKNKHEGTCYLGSYIKEIKSIVRQGNVEISQHHLDCRGIVNIQFEALVIQQEKNDLITDCKIDVKLENERIFGKSSYGRIMFEKHNIFKTIKRGDMIPAKIINSHYAKDSTRISIFATPYIPKFDNNIAIYTIDVKLENKEIEKIHSYIDQMNILKNKIKKFSKNNEKKFNKFVDIYYPYKNKKVPHLLKVNKLKLKLLDINLIKIENPIKFILIKSDEIDKSKSFVLYTEINKLEEIRKYININEQKSKYKYNIIDEAPFVVLESLYISYIKYIIFLIEMTEIYEYPKDTIYWKSIKDYKV